MITKLISIGNSRGIRIPKPLLDDSGLGDGDEVELKVRKGEIKILPVTVKKSLVLDTSLLSENALATDWNKPEEDEAWENLQ